MTPREALEKIRTLSTVLPYDEIMSLLKESVREITLSIAKMAAGTAIDRERKNEGLCRSICVYTGNTLLSKATNNQIFGIIYVVTFQQN